MEVYKYDLQLNDKFMPSCYLVASRKGIYINLEKTFWSNGHIVAPIDNKTPDNFLEESPSFDMIFQDIEKYNHITIIPEYTEFYINKALSMSYINKTHPIVIVHFKGCNIPIPISSRYVDYWYSKYPNCEFRYQNDKNNAVGVYSDNKLIGAVMPMQQHSSYDILDKYCEITNKDAVYYDGSACFLNNLGTDKEFYAMGNMAFYKDNGFVIYDKCYLPDGKYYVLKNQTVKRISDLKDEEIEHCREKVCLQYPIEHEIKCYSKAGSFSVDDINGETEFQKGTLFKNTWGVYKDKTLKEYQVVYCPMRQKIKTYKNKTHALAAAYRASFIERGIGEDFWNSFMPRFRDVFTDVQYFTSGFELSDFFMGKLKLDNAVLFEDLTK